MNRQIHAARARHIAEIAIPPVMLTWGANMVAVKAILSDVPAQILGGLVIVTGILVSRMGRSLGPTSVTSAPHRLPTGILFSMSADSPVPAHEPTARPATPVPVPPLCPGQPPLAILVDYDGTIARTDVSDEILRRFIGERYERDDAAYAAGIVGSRTLYSSQVKLLPGAPDRVVAVAEAQPPDPTFAPFAARARELDVPVEVVSDGFGFYIAPALARLGVPEIPVITARTVFDGRRASMTFPSGHPDCFVCGTCKRQRVLAHQAAGRTVALVGDGLSDLYAAAYSDLTFARQPLLDLCRARGWASTAWLDFAELEGWLDQTVTAWHTDPASLPSRRPGPFICGPEAWGSGRTDPPQRSQHSD